MPKKGFTIEEAERIATELGIDWNSVDYDVEQFRNGLDVELEHGKRDPATNVTNDDPLATGKIALAHLNERGDYYKLLALIEKGALADALGALKSPSDLANAVESYTRVVSLAKQHTTTQEERTMTEHPKFIKVAGKLYQLEESTDSVAPDYIRVNGELFQRDDVLTAAKKKDDAKGGKKGSGAKKTDSEKSKGKWEKLPKGWTQKSAKEFWNSMGGSITKCRQKLKDTPEIDNTGAFCASLKARFGEDAGSPKTKKSKGKSKKASVAPRVITYRGIRYELDE
jgi:hypothetical protein